MASFNKIIIIGYLCCDPELKQTPQGSAVCKFSLATTERRKDGAGEMEEITTWFRVTAWGQLASLGIFDVVAIGVEEMTEIQNFPALANCRKLFTDGEIVSGNRMCTRFRQGSAAGCTTRRQGWLVQAGASSQNDL